MLKLKCVAQNYDWGMVGGCQVAELGQLNTGVEFDKEKPYAELWMGTHPNAPSTVSSTGQTLLDWIKVHPEALGDSVRARFGDDVPYLFKVLSVRKGLSIQAHPDKPAAEKLHAERPNVYKDPNHKPEMALAITPFEALCQFVSPGELKEVMETVPEMVDIVGKEAAAAVVAVGTGGGDPKGPLKAAFTALMTCVPEKVVAALGTLIPRLQGKGKGVSPKEDLILRMNEQYPGDVGVLAVYWLNHCVLQPGEGIYLAANEPHAYMSGECVEIMATSDNVVRAGLTPKLRDTDVLCSMLTYQQGLPTVLRGDATAAATHKAYKPPFDEFELSRVDVPAGSATPLQTLPGGSLFLVLEGEGEAKAAGPAGGAPELESSAAVGRGSVVFVPANTSVEVASAGGMVVYHVGCSTRVYEAAGVPVPALAGAA